MSFRYDRVGDDVLMEPSPQAVEDGVELAGVTEVRIDSESELESRDKRREVEEQGPPASDDEAVEDDEEFPIKAMLALAMALFSNACSVTVLFPFVYFMVRDFQMTDNDQEIGYYAGYIASAFMLGRVLSSFMWGSISDRHGRRPVIFVGLLSVFVSSIAFGMSPSFGFAVAARFCGGFFNGIVAAGKAMAAELCTEKQQPVGMTIISTSWGSGIVLGPAIGGLLTRPADTFGFISPGGLFGTFPYLLPCLFIAFTAVLAIVSVALWLPETSGRGMVTAEAAPEALPSSSPSPSSTASASVSRSPSPIEHTEDNEEEQQRLVEAEQQEQMRVLQHKSDRAGMWKSTAVWLAIAIYSVWSMIDIMFGEAFPLFAATSIEDGGLGFKETQIGLCLTIAGAAILVFNLFLFPRVAAKFGVIGSFRASVWSFVPMAFAFPSISQLTGSPALLWTSLLSIFMLRNAAASTAFTSTFMLINNSVPTSQRGSVNGLAMAIASVFKAIGPSLGGAIYAGSLTGGLAWPLDFHLVFYVTGAFSLITLCLSHKLPERLNHAFDK
eukprot:TRINITY_DN47579_c0_g1_i1.p1 TRINITY_DN47579_c0_g1~~TRINITY_DN47579_c0_g1_i1.p1  ORF type:complete len:554 (-),score=235.31 TRINITY_DN47579_c0_g1_i1:40-1701(-)